MLLFTLTSLVALSLASPTPTNLVSRCGTTLEPSILQIVSQEHSSTVQSTGSNFSLVKSSSPRASNQESTIVTFSNIPSTATTCTLNINIPSTITLPSARNPQVNIFTFTPPAFTTQNDWSWDRIYSPGSKQSLKGMSLFGTVTVEPGTMQTVNSMGCRAEMGFLFEVADWESGDVFVRFAQGGGEEVVLTHSC